MESSSSASIQQIMDKAVQARKNVVQAREKLFQLDKERQKLDGKATRNMREKWNHVSRYRAMEMFKSGDGVDCVIEVQQSGGKEKVEFNVHKFVLVTNSDVFYAMFSHKNTKESREGHILIKDSTATAVRQLIHYMYSGTLPKNYDVGKDAADLMKIADKYQVQPLVEYNEHKLIKSITVKNVFDRLELAELHQIDSLKSACGQIIRKNLKELKETDKWAKLKETSPQLVIAVLEQFPDLVVPEQEDDGDSEEVGSISDEDIMFL